MLTVTGSSLKQRMWGIVLSYQTVTTARISHNVFVSFDKEGKRMVLTYEVSTRTSSACNKSFLQQRKSELNIKENLFGIYSQNYTNKYLEQRNMVSFNTLYFELPNINFMHFNYHINTIKWVFQCFPFYNLGPTLTKVIPNVFQGKPYYDCRV